MCIVNFHYTFVYKTTIIQKSVNKYIISNIKMYNEYIM